MYEVLGDICDSIMGYKEETSSNIYNDEICFGICVGRVSLFCGKAALRHRIMKIRLHARQH